MFSSTTALKKEVATAHNLQGYWHGVDCVRGSQEKGPSFIFSFLSSGSRYNRGIVCK